MRINCVKCTSGNLQQYTHNREIILLVYQRFSLNEPMCEIHEWVIFVTIISLIYTYIYIYLYSNTNLQLHTLVLLEEWYYFIIITIITITTTTIIIIIIIIIIIMFITL